MWNDVTGQRGQALTFGPNVFFLHNPWSVDGPWENIATKRYEKVFAEFPLHIPACLLKNETVVQLSVSQTRYDLYLQIQMQRFISQ